MKTLAKIFVLVMLSMLFPLLTISQTRVNKDDNTVNIDLLKAPQSPAAVLLGIGDSEISRPSDPTAFMVSLRQATGNFTERPTNYAVDIAPLWVFKGKNIAFERFLNNSSIIDNIWQTSVISFAVNENPLKNENDMEIPNSAVGLGFKFSLLRGKVTDQFRVSINKSRNILDSINYKSSIISKDFLNRTNYKALRDSLLDCYSKNCDSLKTAYYNKAVELEIKKAEVEVLKENNGFKDEETRLIKMASEIDFRRIGWKLDCSFGVSYDFPDYVFIERKLSKAGFWISGGYEFPDQFLLLGIARYLYNPDQIFADPEGIIKSDNNQTFDYGVRAIYSIKDFSLSGEIIYRSVLNNKEIEPGYKYQLNAAYTLENNIKLTVNLGKNFDGVITRKGNVIAALNFLMGFGGTKSLN
ncbi:MAG: hypothetical protein IPH57_13165 [Saprospiraceae bacterium]|nr:hypothetical protein [Saprospiraceae bacterium]